MAKEIKVIRTAQRTQKENIAGFTFPEKYMRVALPGDAIPQIRREAYRLFSEGHLPHKLEEAWRRTPLDHLNPGKFSIVENEKSGTDKHIPAHLLNPLKQEEQTGQTLIISDEGIKKEFSTVLQEKNIIFTDLQDAEKNHTEKLEKIFGKIVKPEDGYFSAMATAFAQTGVFIYIPKNTQLDTPLHSILWADHANEAILSHVLIYLDEGASLTYVHEVSSPFHQSEEIFHNGNVEIFVGPGASLKFVELQSWGDQMLNFTHERAVVEKDGQLEWIFGAVGSKLTKNFTDVDLIGQGASGKISGFYFTNGHQHLDLDTQQNHKAANTTSDLLYKGALLDESRSVWQGMIYVAPEAQKIDGYQANRNLLLGENARADSIPGLEILADDVRCSHGATVGRIDTSQTFYLESRGIPKLDAAKLVVEGFFDDIMQRIPFDGIRQRFQDAIHEKMETFHL
jgi:Fe-S cluster assembly protein SufD